MGSAKFTSPNIAYEAVVPPVVGSVHKEIYGILASLNCANLEEVFRKREPDLQAFLAEEGRFERLHRDARELLERYPDPRRRPALFGIPVGVKDIFNVDGFETRAGSQLPASEFEGPEAECVTRLKNAGALILGKTVTAQFAYLAPGVTRNPHQPEHTPGGSSSGSAAAVGAGMCALTLGAP